MGSRPLNSSPSFGRGCARGQGYLFSKSQSADAFAVRASSLQFKSGDGHAAALPLIDLGQTANALDAAREPAVALSLVPRILFGLIYRQAVDYIAYPVPP